MTAFDGDTAAQPVPPLDEELPPVLNSIEASDKLLLCLDFDGTLAPIVDDPKAAEMPAETEQAIDRLASKQDIEVAIISGRSLASLRARVEPDVTLAGNHGLEIERGETEWVHPDVARHRDQLDQVCRTIEQRLIEQSGVFLENKGITATVHYRRAPAGTEQPLRETIQDVTSTVPGLVVTEGKCIFEIRPDVSWNKGNAVEKLLEESGTDLALYLGDDDTDEDAFRVLAGTNHIGIVVGKDKSAAAYRLDTVEAVQQLLETLAESDIGTETD